MYVLIYNPNDIIVYWIKILSLVTCNREILSLFVAAELFRTGVVVCGGVKSDLGGNTESIMVK
jgi:hypothetical protein